MKLPTRAISTRSKLPVENTEGLDEYTKKSSYLKNLKQPSSASVANLPRPPQPSTITTSVYTPIPGTAQRSNKLDAGELATSSAPTTTPKHPTLTSSKIQSIDTSKPPTSQRSDTHDDGKYSSTTCNRNGRKVTWATEWTYHDYTPTDHITSKHISPTLGPVHEDTHQIIVDQYTPPLEAPSPLVSSRTREPLVPTLGTVVSCDQSTILNETTISASERSINPNITSDFPTETPPPSGIHTSVPWPQGLIQLITSIVSSEPPPPAKPEFQFEMTREAALRNFCVIQKYGDIEKAIEGQRHSPVGYGSEFRAIDILTPLLKHHPYWEKFKSLLSRGSDWPLTDIDDDKRQADVQEALQFGNHKRATEDPTLLKSLIVDDVIHGFTLPLPLEKITRINGVLLAPMNIAYQDTIDEMGNIIPKKRLTHDQSFIFQGSGTSVNSRVDKSKLTPCIFGWVIRRLANWIVTARRKYPNRRIYATKVDFKSAYRRCHLYYRIALQSCTQLPTEGLALLPLRLTFGGAPCPYEWSTISELICDLATAIITDEDWDPHTLHSPDQHLVPKPTFLPDDIPFGEGKELIVDIDVDEHGIHEMY
ncbi:hypothetical protein ACHAWU_004714 [Discostella pseudostelligera]|uniref:Reverse transcriptase domain-containing protein n=1 Tax=Discostella pseudostelligera TaxID=259834 RepID=A0ABD3M611_9STRA